MEEKLKYQSKNQSETINKRVSFHVGKEDEGIRLDQLCTKIIPTASRSLIKRYFNNPQAQILVNGEKKSPHYLVKVKDKVEISIPPVIKLSVKPVAIPLDIIYEDDDLLVINKQPGLTVHPAAGHKNDTLVNAILNYMKNSGSLSHIGGVERPGIVHRLDRDTSGVIIIAKNDHAHTDLSRQFHQRTVEKVYEAIVKGVMPQSKGEIKGPIARHPKNRKKFIIRDGGKEALTFYEVIDSKGESTWVRFFPKTGRTHQIRVHSTSIGHPIMGDPLYARKATITPYIALVAKEITIHHPTTGEKITFTAPYPMHFIELARNLGYEIPEL